MRGEGRGEYRIGAVFSNREIIAGIVDSRHRVVSRASLALGAGCDYRETARLVADCAGLAARGLGIDPDRCASVGVGCPGIANRETGEVVYSGPMVWNHVPFGKELQKQFPRAQTVSVAELAGCTALGESLAGAALRCTQVVLFQFGAGISSGVVVDGRIFGGKYCAGARLGHCTIVSGGKTCSCGRKGCFEAYASLEALAEQAREAVARYKNTLLGRYDALTISPAEVMDCARKGDRAARRVLGQYIDYVSDGIVNAVNAFRPEIVVLGGAEVKFWKESLDEINSRCCERYYGAALLPVPKVVLASLGVDAGLIGAAALGEAGN